MGRLLADYIHRNAGRLVGAFVLFYFFGLNTNLNLGKFSEGYSFYGNPGLSYVFFLGLTLAGAWTFAHDLRRGYGRVIRTLPVGARQLAGASWVVSVALLPAIAAAALAGAILSVMPFGPSYWPMSLSSAPQALLEGVALAGTFYLLIVLTNADSKKDSWSEALRWVYIFGLIFLLAWMAGHGPRFYNRWGSREGGKLLILGLGLCAAALSLVSSPHLLDRRISARSHGAGGRAAKSSRAPGVFPSRGLSMAAPWLRPFVYSLAGALLLLLLMAWSGGNNTGLPADRGKLTPLLLFGEGRSAGGLLPVFVMDYDVIFSLIIIYMVVGVQAFKRHLASLRAYRCLPLSAARLAAYLVRSIAMPYVAGAVVVLALPLVLRSRGSLNCVSALAFAIGLASLACGLRIRFGVSFSVFLVPLLVAWIFSSAFSSHMAGPPSARYFVPAVLLPSGIENPIFDTILALLIGLGYLLIRQGIAVSSRPYRAADASTEGER